MKTLIPLFTDHLEERAILRQLKTVSDDQLRSIINLAAFTIAHARYERDDRKANRPKEVTA